MTTIQRKEIKKRGFFGWLFLLLFLAFNALMALWVIGAIVSINEVPATDEFERAGRAIGAGIGITMLLFVWLFGPVITGWLALLTRSGKTIIVEHDAK